MQLQQIDKSRYDKHFKMVFALIVVALLCVSLLVSTLLIHLVGNPDGGNFWLNFAGVVVGAITIATFLDRFRAHPFLTEVVYVWDLKQMLNRIQRKQEKLKAAIAEGDRNAMIIMNFHFNGARQLYELDDNTITMDQLLEEEAAFHRRMAEHGVSLTLDEFDPRLLDRY